jgi:Rrf2 family protein
MLKLTKKADYGLIALKHLAESGPESCSAKDIAEAYDIPQEAMAKILQRLVKSGFLRSHHGTNGGYVLARDPKAITAFEVIRAIDGPLFITSCSSEHDNCHQSSKCNVKEPLQKVNQSIREVLNRITVADMGEGRPRSSNEIESSDKPMELVTLAHS